MYGCGCALQPSAQRGLTMTSMVNSNKERAKAVRDRMVDEFLLMMTQANIPLEKVAKMRP
jgi:hypothetical protein